MLEGSKNQFIFFLNYLSVEIDETFFAIDIMEFSKTRNTRIDAHRMCA